MHRRRTFVLLISGIAVALVLAAGYAWQSRGGGEAGEPNLLDAVNAKLQQQGEPTISPENDTGSGRRVDPTVEAIADATLAALPDPEKTQSLTCGPLTERQGPIARSYGEIRDGCGLVGNHWVVTTLGEKPAPGVIAVFDCADSDESCLKGGEPKSGQWVLLDLPVKGGVTIMGINPPDEIVVDSGGAQLCIDLAKLGWNPSCSALSTSPAGTLARTPAPTAAFNRSGGGGN